MVGSGQQGNGIPADIRTDVAHPARVYDYWLGGKDNFAADRAAAEQVLQVMPEILDTVRGNRQFMVRAVKFLRDAGIRQFLDIGSGLPSSPNVHEIAQVGNTGARVVYVDHDPVVFSHAGAMTAKNDDTNVVGPTCATQPTYCPAPGNCSTSPGLLGCCSSGACITSQIPATRPASWPRYLAALTSGSYLVISHATNEFSPEKMQANADVADNSGTMLIPRSRDAILHMFNGRELVDPGLVLVSRWRPEGGEPGPNADRAWAYGGVAAL